MDIIEQLPSVPSGAILALYLRTDKTDTFQVGVPLAQGEPGTVCVRLLDPSGQFDGCLFCRTEQIYRLEWDSRYLRALPHPERAEPEFSSRADFLKFFSQKPRILKLLGRNMRTLANGYLCSRDAEALTILPVYRDGREGKRKTVALSKISGVCFACKETLRLERLHEEKCHEIR